MKTPKRPCAVCRRWFFPNARTRHCQKTCGDEECRRKWRRRRHSRWREANPEYWAERRLEEKAEKVAAGSKSIALKPPPQEVAKVPWDMAQDAFGARGVVFLGFLVRLLLRSAQSAIQAQQHEKQNEFRRHCGESAQSAIGSQVEESVQEIERHDVEAAQSAMDRS